MYSQEQLKTQQYYLHISGFDPKDSTSSRKPVPDYAQDCLKDFKPVTIGIPIEFLDGLDSKVCEVFEDNIKILEKDGCKVKKISLESSKLGVSAYQVVAPAECSSNLSRYDGVRFGYRAKNVKNIEELYKKSRSDALELKLKEEFLLELCSISRIL